METLVIKVSSEKEGQRLKQELERNADVVSVTIVPPKTSSPEQPFKPEEDEITRVSEASLAEAWNSPEDDVWDDFYQELCTRKAM